MPTDRPYNAKSLKTLEGLEPVRARPGMYIGSTDERGLVHLVHELMDNATDEALAGHANHMTVIFYPDGSIEVKDNGRGIPVDKEPSSGMVGIELVMTKLHAGGKFHTDAYKVSGGLHGVGASIVNALSTRMEVRVTRDRYHWAMDFTDGNPGPLRKIAKATANQHGTAIRFWPDKSVFATAVINTEKVIESCQSRAYLIPGFKVRLIDNRVSSPQQHEWISKKGMVDYLNVLSSTKAICAPIVIAGTGTYEGSTRVQSPDGSMHTQAIERTCEVEVCMRWTSEWEPRIYTWANLIPTPHGGSHINGFWQAMAKAINDYARQSKALRVKDPALSREDIQEGLVVLLQVKLPEPQFEGQTKEVLGTQAVHSVVYKIVYDEFMNWLVKQGPRSQVKAVLTKIVTASRTRLAAREERNALRQQSAVSNAALPDKLADCRQHYPKDSELLIVEGRSAAAPCKEGRNSLFQAVLPLRGKIINAGKYGLQAVLKNEEVVSIFTSLGIVPGKYDDSSLRYSRVVLMTDADVDGSHIRCLLLALFYYYARPMIEKGHVFYARPPLFTIRTSGKSDQYAYTDAQRDVLIRKAQKTNYKILRFKGLGEMDVDELTYTCLNPATRALTQISLADAEATAQIFEVLMGEAVPPRREYIFRHADKLNYHMLDI